VSWRYSADHAALRGRRREVDEPWLTRTLLKLSESCQKNWDDEQKKKITERRSGDTKTFLSVFFFFGSEQQSLCFSQYVAQTIHM
jgi:hypothetical protein